MRALSNIREGGKGTGLTNALSRSILAHCEKTATVEPSAPGSDNIWLLPINLDTITPAMTTSLIFPTLSESNPRQSVQPYHSFALKLLEQVSKPYATAGCQILIDRFARHIGLPSRRVV